MAHSIEPNKEHALVTITLAIRPEYSRNLAMIADGLNEILRIESMSENGLLADYTLYGLNQINYITASTDPEEGEFFQEAEGESNVRSPYP